MPPDCATSVVGAGRDRAPRRFGRAPVRRCVRSLASEGTGRRHGARAAVRDPSSDSRPADLRVCSGRASAQDRPRQIAPRLGASMPTSTHRNLLSEARGQGADLVRLPELGLTVPAPDLARRSRCASTTRGWRNLAGETRGSRRVSFVEESAEPRCSYAAALIEDGEIRHVHRKLFLPTYGLFDERGSSPRDTLRRGRPSRLAVGSGSALCEDFWHVWSHSCSALDGAARSSSTCRPHRAADLAANQTSRLGTATSWRTLMRTYVS